MGNTGALVLSRTGLDQSCEKVQCEENYTGNPELEMKIIYFHCYKHENGNNEDMSGKLEFQADPCNNGVLLLLYIPFENMVSFDSVKYEYRIAEFEHELLKPPCELSPIVHHRLSRAFAFGWS